MTIHYSVESLTSLFLSDSFQSDKNKYKQTIKKNISTVIDFLNSIEINKQYYRTGIIVKNPKYKKKVGQDTLFLKSFKTSLNKLSSINYKKLTNEINTELGNKSHLYPLVIQSIFEQALLHHNYSSYYCYLIQLVSDRIPVELIYKQIKITKDSIQSSENTGNTEYSKLCFTNKQLDQLIGFNIFLSELELNNIISGYVDDSIQMLISIIKNQTIESDIYKSVMCLYSLLNSYYKTSELPESYKDSIISLKDSCKFMKIKFKYMDIIERR